MAKLTVLVAVSHHSKGWEDASYVSHTFNTWAEVVTFAYRLSLQFCKEVRVENKGNGHYFAPHNALNFLQ